MNYIGSKNKLSGFIANTIMHVTGNLDDKIFTELFAGTGIVARKLKHKVKKVIVNDIEDYSYVLLRNYIGNHKQINFWQLIDQINSIEGKEGFIYNNYCAGSGSGRNYFTDENGKKIDAVRMKAEKYLCEKKINEDEYYFILASLIESADKVANTASVYAAYLKKIKKSAEKHLVIEPAFYELNEKTHEVYQEDANEIITKITGDILYLDPPYNERQYGNYYHILNTIVKYDHFVPAGKTGMREYRKSDYCKKGKVADVFEDLISKAEFPFIFLSYNNEGLMTLNTIKKLMQKFGKYELVKTSYQRYKADRNREYSANNTTEYLHILRK